MNTMIKPPRYSREDAEKLIGTAEKYHNAELFPKHGEKSASGLIQQLLDDRERLLDFLRNASLRLKKGFATKTEAQAAAKEIDKLIKEVMGDA